MNLLLFGCIKQMRNYAEHQSAQGPGFGFPAWAAELIWELVRRAERGLSSQCPAGAGRGGAGRPFHVLRRLVVLLNGERQI